GREVPRVERGCRAPTQLGDLRRRRADRTVHRYQAHRHRDHGAGGALMRRQLLTGLLMTIAMMLLVGLIYPFAMTGIAQVAFHDRANGSLVKVDGKYVGSSLIGQNFVLKDGSPDPRYFQPRPSAAGDGYDAMASGGTNNGPSNANLIGNVPKVAIDASTGKPFTSNPYATPSDPYCVHVQATDKDGNGITDKVGNAVYENSHNGRDVCCPNTVPQRA